MGAGMIETTEERVAKQSGMLEEMSKRLTTVEAEIRALRANINNRFTSTDNRSNWVIGLVLTS